ncbi:c-type cytochrome [Algoriphagus winogradskyi]|uniref:Cytochrome c551/c552 n=1 Tax=Algoriphagus winogradskyi TaxID=237017 RepID=A0ABY1N7S8_9BACT|nr:c-type cytochrome [Algoriphagus winogradskyi]SMP02375.1 Cytochrome c551/c552 [Algoriphagus winogradskyi]
MNTLLKNKFTKIAFGLAAVFQLMPGQVDAQESPKEEDFFKIMRVTAPEGTLLEVGGLTVLPNGDLGVATRRGDVFIVENPTSSKPFFRKFASGLHEILGLHYEDGAFYMAQRGELTKLVDTDQDGTADLYETVYAWPISTHYHEYSFGPKVGPDGSFFVSANVAFGDQEWWRGESRVPMRGWIMKINRDGSMEPYATGMRSPAGLGMLGDKLVYTENQGDYMGSGGLWFVEKGDFTGHPAGLAWTGLPDSPLKLTTEEFNKVVDPQKIPNGNGGFLKPENVIDAPYITMAQAKEKLPDLKLPAVWLPHGIQGISNSEPIVIPEGNFGPFGGQVLVGDQGQSKIMRVVLEEVDGVMQGASIDFRSGFQSGILRMAWAPDKSLFIGETNRGWGSAGEANEGLQRLVWNHNIPFEMRTVKAQPDGFLIEFTKPVNKATAEDLTSYAVESFTYKYYPVYGSPPVDNKTLKILGVEVAADGMSARIAVEGLRESYVHKLSLNGVRAADGSFSLVHPDAYYTLHNIPAGTKMVIKTPVAPEPKKEVAAAAKPAPVKATSVASAIPSDAEIKTLLAKNTCSACHMKDKKVIGPAYTDVAKRRYSDERIVELIYNPEPQNWPDYATPMPPMAQVSKEDAMKIAKWINSLR